MCFGVNVSLWKPDTNLLVTMITVLLETLFLKSSNTHPPPVWKGGGVLPQGGPSQGGVYMEVQMMTENEMLDILAQAKRGTIHTLKYLKREKQKGLKDLYNVQTVQIRLADYESMGKVVEYRESTGVGPNNPAVKNEVATDIFGVYLNPKTNKMKLRVPLNGCSVLGVTYYIGDREVSKEEYYAEYEGRGYKKPEHKASATGVEFRSFVLEQIIYFK